MFWPTLVVPKQRVVEEADRFYRVVAFGLSSLILLGGALHLLLFVQRVAYVPLFDLPLPAAAQDRVGRLLDREGVAWLERDGAILVPSSARESCRARIERELAAPAADAAASAVIPAPGPTGTGAGTTSGTDGSETFVVHAHSPR